MHDMTPDQIHAQTMGKIDQTLQDHNDALMALSKAHAAKPAGPPMDKAGGAESIGLVGIGGFIKWMGGK